MNDAASWYVQYEDGTLVAQYDHRGTEVPMSTIDWPRVRQLKFDSQWVQRSFDVTPVAGRQLALRQRHFKSTSGVGVMCFLVCVHDVGRPVQESDEVTYWFPDDTLHQCRSFECGDVAEYALGVMRDAPHQLKPIHDHVQLTATAAL